MESDPSTATRTWEHLMAQVLQSKTGETRTRWERAIKDKAFDSIRKLVLIETKAEQLQALLQRQQRTSQLTKLSSRLEQIQQNKIANPPADPAKPD